MPPRHSQLEVIRLDTGSGRILWYSCFPEVQIPEYKPFYGYWTINNEVFALDPLTGMSRLVTQCPGEASTPLIMENKIWTGWVLRGQIGIGCFDALTGAIIHCNNWPRKRGHDIYIHGTEHPPILGINDQFVCLLNDDLSPRWEVRVRPWVYGIASCGNGPVFIGTSGNGGLFCSVDRQTGVIINQVGLPNGAPHPVSMPDLGMVASDYGKGLVIGDGLTGEIHTVKRPGGHTIIGSYGNQVIALCSSPSTGLILIDADNLRQKRTNN